MTEAEWLECGEPETLLEFVRGRTTERKCRLLATSFCRYVLPLVHVHIGHRAVEVAEEFADGRVSLEYMLATSKQVFDSYVSSAEIVLVNTEPSLSDRASSIALQSTAFLTGAFANYLDLCCRCTDLATRRWARLRAGPDEVVAPWRSLIQWQFSHIQDVIGNPFRPKPLATSWLTNNVTRLACAAYEERLPDGRLDNTLLPVLADAVEEAGGDMELVAHLRDPCEHWRGCWGLDAILGKA